jgi:hypothetical protein
MKRAEGFVSFYRVSDGVHQVCFAKPTSIMEKGLYARRILRTRACRVRKSGLISQRRLFQRYIWDERIS